MVKTNSNINFSFQFKGIGKFEDVNNEVIRLNTLLEKQNLPFIVLKRVYSISIELLYNVIYHGHKINGDIPELDFNVISDKKQITLKCSNHIEHKEVTNLRSVISKLNQTEFDELRKMKSHQIKNGGISEKGGAGLGLIDISMKADHPITPNFKLIDQNTDWITLEVKVDLV